MLLLLVCCKCFCCNCCCCCYCCCCCCYCCCCCWCSCCCCCCFNYSSSSFILGFHNFSLATACCCHDGIRGRPPSLSPSFSPSDVSVESEVSDSSSSRTLTIILLTPPAATFRPARERFSLFCFLRFLRFYKEGPDLVINHFHQCFHSSNPFKTIKCS